MEEFGTSSSDREGLGATGACSPRNPPGEPPEAPSGLDRAASPTTPVEEAGASPLKPLVEKERAPPWADGHSGSQKTRRGLGTAPPPPPWAVCFQELLF